MLSDFHLPMQKSLLIFPRALSQSRQCRSCTALPGAPWGAQLPHRRGLSPGGAVLERSFLAATAMLDTSTLPLQCCAPCWLMAVTELPCVFTHGNYFFFYYLTMHFHDCCSQVGLCIRTLKSSSCQSFDFVSSGLLTHAKTALDFTWV